MYSKDLPLDQKGKPSFWPSTALVCYASTYYVIFWNVIGNFVVSVLVLLMSMLLVIDMEFISIH